MIKLNKSNRKGGNDNSFLTGGQTAKLAPKKEGTMKIKKITWQNRRDFSAIYECEHCGSTREGSGYDDSYFHKSVIPNMTCDKCGKKADETYRPLATKYPDSMQI